jgi:hypothetical protein
VLFCFLALQFTVAAIVLVLLAFRRADLKCDRGNDATCTYESSFFGIPVSSVTFAVSDLKRVTLEERKDSKTTRYQIVLLVKGEKLEVGSARTEYDRQTKADAIDQFRRHHEDERLELDLDAPVPWLVLIGVPLFGFAGWMLSYAFRRSVLKASATELEIVETRRPFAQRRTVIPRTSVRGAFVTWVSGKTPGTDVRIVLVDGRQVSVLPGGSWAPEAKATSEAIVALFGPAS